MISTSNVRKHYHLHARWRTLTTAYGTQLPRLMATLSPFLMPRSRRPRANASLSRLSSRYDSWEDGVLTAVLVAKSRHTVASFRLIVSSNKEGCLVAPVNNDSVTLESLHALLWGQTGWPDHVLLPHLGSSPEEVTFCVSHAEPGQ